MTDGTFQGQNAIVTGGASGIGRAVVELLAARGASVVVADYDQHTGQTLANDSTRAGGRVAFVRTDVGDPDSTQAAVRFAEDTFGSLHLAVNSAGVPQPAHQTADIPLEVWHRQTRINLDGVFYSLRAEIPAILRSGGGAIVNLASILGLRGMALRTGYTTTKHAVVGLTRGAALDYATEGLRINCVAPGYTDTPLLKDRDDDARNAIAALHPMARMGRPQEIAETICFLLSSQASFMTGACVDVDGGYLAR